jgi:cyanophycinase-like exopeptidase
MYRHYHSCLRCFTVAFLVVLTSVHLSAQTYRSFFTGDTADVVRPHTPGIVLAGGGTDNNDAMSWLIRQASGGDVVVLRASGSDGYNRYLFADLGVTVNSVETLLVTSLAGANDPYVERRIREAEAIFIAGGDQYLYYSLWRNTRLHEALQWAISQKRITVGGTSAGMMVLSGAYYTPSGSGITSDQALQNPYHPAMDILGNGDFLSVSLLRNVITDTHYDQRGRAGRHVTMMARLEQDRSINVRGIACNERTAVCIPLLGADSGIAKVYGSRAEDFAYFMQSHCDVPQSLPEVCKAGEPLTWNKSGQAVKVYAVQGTTLGTNSFDLRTWNIPGSTSIGTHGGTWQHWAVVNGQLQQRDGTPPNCGTASSRYTPLMLPSDAVQIHPNPAQDNIMITVSTDYLRLTPEHHVRAVNVLGQSFSWYHGQAQPLTRVGLDGYPAGQYSVYIENLRTQTIAQVGSVVITR